MHTYGESTKNERKNEVNRKRERKKEMNRIFMEFARTSEEEERTLEHRLCECNYLERVRFVLANEV